MAFKVDSSSDLISEFNLRKYQNEGNALVDGSEYLANVKEQVISFYFEPTGETVFFKAFITTFNDSFTPSYSTTQVFGRTDPIQIYQNTTRQISLAFQVPAASEGEAFENLGRVQKIIHMLYPGYANLDNALTLTEAPLTRIKVMNLLSNQSSFKEARTNDSGQDVPDLPASDEMGKFEDYYSVYKSTSAPDKGTLGVITSFTVNHNLENPQMGVFEKSANTILPKVIDVNLSFTPFHEETIGRLVTDPRNSSVEAGTVNVDDFTDRMKGFPYGVDLGNSTGHNLKTAGGAQTKAVALRRDAEEARRKASAAQQELDKVKATNRRVTRQLNRMNRRGEIDDVSTNQAKTSLALNQGDAAYDLAQAEREAQAAEQTYQDFIE
jgi:hypothetical protein